MIAQFWKVLSAGVAIQLAGATAADAGCPPPFHVNPVIRVGNKTVDPVDAACDFDTVQEAISAAGSTDPTCPTVIAITREHTWSNQNLSVANKSIRLVGQADGVTCSQVQTCDPIYSSCPTAPQTTLSASGSGTVLTMTGTATYVELDGMTITGGNTGGDGGGISFSGSGSLALSASIVDLNQAAYGGGIEVNGTGTGASLTLGFNTLIDSNTANVSGGGIRIEGTTRLFALQPQTLIGYNHATGGYGGGIEILGPARADIGSPGYGNSGAIYGNDAVYGAGVAAIDNGNGTAVLRTFATSAHYASAIDGNFGATKGGGIYAVGEADVCLFATRIANNSAEDGAAIYADYNSNDVRAGIYFNDVLGDPPGQGPECGPEVVSDLGGSTSCAPYDSSCSAITGNITLHPDGTGAAGAVVEAWGTVQAERLRLQGNTANSIVHTHAGTSLRRCLATDNIVSGSLFYSEGDFEASGCTIANNFTYDTGGFVFDVGYSPHVLLDYDIIAEGYVPIFQWFDYPYSTFQASSILAYTTAGFDQSNPSIVQGAVYFVDAAHGDYHLAPVQQVALDFGYSTSPLPVFPDLDGNDHLVDLPGIVNYLPTGAADLGAYERQNMFDNCGSVDTLFCTGFER